MKTHGFYTLFLFFGWIASSLIFVVAPRNDFAFSFCHCERSYASRGNPLICTSRIHLQIASVILCLLTDFPHIFHKLARILCLLHLLKTYIPCIYALDLWYILLTITLLQHYITKVNCFFSFFYKSLKKFKFLNIYICLFKIIPLYGRG